MRRGGGIGRGCNAQCMTDGDLGQFEQVWWARESESSSLVRGLYAALLESSDSLAISDRSSMSAPLSSSKCAVNEYPRDSAA